MIFSLALFALTLYQQTVAGILRERFASAEYVLLDGTTGEPIDIQWPGPDKAVPVGSLVKPLLLAAHAGNTPVFTCTGRGCWLPRGHGKQNANQALANSCNEYFDAFAARLPQDRLESFVARYGLRGPSVSGSRIGRGYDWPVAPVSLLNAYRELRDHPAIYKGMSDAAIHGTAKALGPGLLAKTGTSACSHARKGAGDGYAIVLLPASKPEWALLVRVHETTGAMAARVASGIVRVIREGK